jgi:hypothetical protein
MQPLALVHPAEQRLLFNLGNMRANGVPSWQEHADTDRV